MMNQVQPNIQFKEISPHYHGVSDILKLCVGQATSEKMNQILNSYFQPNQHLIGVINNNELIGIIGFHLEKPSAVIRHISITKDYRKQKIGKNLLAYVLKHYSINILQTETDEEALGFYKRCGFHCTSCTSQYANRYSCILNKNNIG